MNQSQHEIIYDTKFLTTTQALCVVACAGSGKTTTIIKKIKYMIEHLNCKSSDFIICTFTNNAVDDIISRVDNADLDITTFHSVGLRELIKYNYKIIKNTPEPIPEEYLIKYLELLETPSYVFRFKYIFIDEYQDINELQYNIIQKWFKHCKLLLVVGDDQQNIYTFRNTSIKYILNFNSDFCGEYKYLNINYRSNKGIINLTNAIIKFNSDRIDKTIIADSIEPLIKPKIRFFNSQINEYKYIIKHIQKIKQISNNQSIAILCRTNKILIQIEKYLYINHNQILSDIHLLTIHSAKGLEYDNVLIINCVDGLIPIINSDIQEERRLFYVGCSRARKTLLITSEWDNIQQPSRFIYEIYKSNIDLINIVKFEWIINPDQTYTITNPNHSIRQRSITNILLNLTIETYQYIMNNKLLPKIEDQVYKLINIHQPLEIDIDINFLLLYIQRIIYEYLDIDNYIYLEYIINEPLIKQHSKILKSNIQKYLNNTDNSLLLSSIEYIKTNTNIDIKIDHNTILNIYNIIISRYMLFDMNINKSILSKSYTQFQDKNNKTIDILESINSLSKCYDYINNKYPTHIMIPITPTTLSNIDNFIQKIISDSLYVDSEYYIMINNSIIGKINLILDNKMLIINNNKPSINDYIKYLLMAYKYNMIHKLINKIEVIQLYNPINGTIIEWDIVDHPYNLLYDYLIDQ